MQLFENIEQIDEAIEIENREREESSEIIELKIMTELDKLEEDI